jgi:hypothetical protein
MLPSGIINCGRDGKEALVLHEIFVGGKSIILPSLPDVLTVKIFR